MVKFLAKATSLIGLILFATGCAAHWASVNGKQGATQYPSEIKPLIFVNFSTGFIDNDKIHYPYGSEKPIYWPIGIGIENEKTHEYYAHVFNRLQPSKLIDGRVSAPGLITLPPGDYILTKVGIRSYDRNDVVGVEKFNGPRFNVPDKDFCSLGTIDLTFTFCSDRYEGSLRGASLDAGAILAFSERSGSLRPLSPLEKIFAVQSYPFLKDLNLTP